MTLRGQDIVCVSSLDWDAHWTSKQQIMHRLAETNRVLYVEEPVTMLAPLKVPARLRRWSAVLPRMRRAQPGLWVLTPPPLLPFGNMYPAVNRLNQRVIAAYICWALARLRFRGLVLWTYLPASVHLIDRLRPAAVVYHCVDEHSAFPGFVDREVVRAYDDELTSRADLVLTSALSLFLSRRHLNRHIHHVLHAADVAHFGRALRADLPVPEDIAAIPRPRIGVIGVHDERLDVDALECLARADADWQIVLVGPMQPGDVDEARLRALPNVHLLGGKPLNELPGYLKALDVALIPYRLNELTRNIFPLKLFEYFAGGVPVVAAALPELEPFRDMIGLALDAEAYPGLVRAALECDNERDRATRVELAAANTWDGRVEEISGLVEEMLVRKQLDRTEQ
jgi:glycosyltransferase involved in cell wall biosynthesis